MNNFKKLLASAMALTMVTSVIPATNANAAIITNTACDETTKGVYAEMSYLFNQTNLERTDFVDEKTVGSQSLLEYLNDDGVYGTTTKGAARIQSLKDIAGTDGWSCAADTETRDKAQYILDAYTALNSLYNDNGELTGESTAYTGVLNIVDARLSSDRWYTVSTLKANEGVFEKALIHATFLEDVIGNYSDNMPNDDYNNAYRLFVELSDRMDEARPGWEFDQQKELVLKLENALKAWIDYETGEDVPETDNSITKDEVTEFIRSVEKGYQYPGISEKDVNFERISQLYAKYSDNEDVVEIMESVEAMYDEITEVRALINRRTNDVYADYLDAADNYDDFADVQVSLTMSDYETFKAFKEEVVDVVINYNVKEYANFYSVTPEKSLYITSAELNVVLKDFFASNNLNGPLAFNEKTGTFAWDTLVAHMEDVIKYYDAVSTGIEALDAVNLTVADKDAITTADDGLAFFEDESYERHGHLTSAERRVVRDNTRKINELYEAYRSKFGSLSGATGWQDMGNGDWKYYEADGTAPTRWICSAKDTWYYVENGVMLRNAWVWRDANSAYYVGDDGKMWYGPATTPDGYAIDANGLWHR